MQNIRCSKTDCNRKEKKGDIEDNILVINISDQKAGYGRLQFEDEQTTSAIGSDKNILTKCDIMVSKLGMPRGYIFIKPEYNGEIIGSSEFIPYCLCDKTEGKFYVYLLLTSELRKAYFCLESGKTPSHKRVNTEEFLKIKIPLIEHDKIMRTISKIEEYEKIIDEQHNLQIDANVIINKVFSEEFNFDENLYNYFGKGMSFGTQKAEMKGIRISNVISRNISSSNLLRLSARANNDATGELMDILNKIPHLRVKDILKEDIHRGVSPQYVEDGDIPVVKTAHLRNGEILKSEEEFVTIEFFERKERAQVRLGDILLASTGKPSIGKIDLVDEDTKYFADGHISIIRIDESKYNRQFFVFWFRCILGYFQIERDFVGCTNQVEIYEEQIKEFIIPNISVENQIKIVKKINSRLEIQKRAEMIADEYRKKIDEEIIKTIKE